MSGPTNGNGADFKATGAAFGVAEDYPTGRVPQAVIDFCAAYKALGQAHQATATEPHAAAVWVVAAPAPEERIDYQRVEFDRAWGDAGDEGKPSVRPTPRWPA